MNWIPVQYMQYIYGLKTDAFIDGLCSVAIWGFLSLQILAYKLISLLKLSQLFKCYNLFYKEDKTPP